MQSKVFELAHYIGFDLIQDMQIIPYLKTLALNYYTLGMPVNFPFSQFHITDKLRGKMVIQTEVSFPQVKIITLLFLVRSETLNHTFLRWRHKHKHHLVFVSLVWKSERPPIASTAVGEVILYSTVFGIICEQRLAKKLQQDQ